MLDRTKAPTIKMPDDVQLPAYQLHYLDNGIPVYEVQMGTQEVIKLELVFNAGRPFEEKKLVSRATTSLLREGTTTHSAGEMAELFDFYGCSLSLPYNLDTANIVVYSLSRYLEKILPLLKNILESPSFSQTELTSFATRQQQLLREDLTKNEVVAYRTITELIFGNEHPYGYNSVEEMYATLQRDDLLTHFNRTYTVDNCRIFMSGKTSPTHLKVLNRYIGSLERRGKVSSIAMPEVPSATDKLFIPRTDSVQTAVRMGRRLFNREHEDYAGMYVLNALLGGYFGSRLMANIREDKGYTYHIFSQLDVMKFDGYLYIGTEVGNEFVSATCDEIYKELALLREELVSVDELEMVKNYLLGTYLTMVDGPFQASELVKTMILEDLPENFFSTLVKTTRDINAKQILELANRYLKIEDIWQVSVGAPMKK